VPVARGEHLGGLRAVAQVVGETELGGDIHRLRDLIAPGQAQQGHGLGQVEVGARMNWW
jgi:hypothetical protein